jgi:hypothetical protein
MNTKQIFSWLLFLFGEAILIASFVLFRGETPDNILVMNIVVSTIVYALLFFNYRAPWIDLKDKSQKQIGAIGISWFVAWFYAIAAIVVMLAANLVLGLSFTVQLIIHCVLLFFLVLGILLSLRASDKVAEIYQTETANRSGILEMKKAMRILKDKISETAGLPETFIQRVNSLEESLRFISPTDNSEAYELEYSFVETVNTVRFALNDYSLNAEQVENNLKKCERILYNRKQIYSN